MKLVEVELVDMEHDAFGWQSLGRARRRKPRRYRAVGYIVKSTRRWLVLAPLVRAAGPSGLFCAYRIPRGAVRSVRRLRS